MIKQLFVFLLPVLLFTACGNKNNVNNAENSAKPTFVAQDRDGLSVATFAGGCFWCTEAVFERTKGVVDVESGYTGGDEVNPTYEQVGRGSTGHTEAIQIYYDPEVIDYATLFEIFMVTHDPTQLNRQGPDVGTQYRSGVYYRTAEEKAIIDSQIAKLNDSGEYDKKVVTEVAAFDKFYVAEDYHQNYYELHPENPYVQRISRPKVEKFKKLYGDTWLKDKYRPSK